MGGDVEYRVSNDNADNDFKIKQNEDWAKLLCRTNFINIINWNKNGCLMCPRWFSKKYCFGNCKNKASHVPDNEVPEDKRKAYKTYLKKICS